ncbi:MAG: efflux transporter periplasmic adaptor subunit, partial [Bacteroidia bacterium]|nr:efflux transporter periplasmic adaptor subunit [Bacteroidia bacterium]
ASAASAPSAPVSGSQNVAAKAPQPALAGPSPCGVVVSEAPAMVVPVRSVSTPPRSPAPTAGRDPA